MIFLHRPETAPHFNIAAEEYILRNYEQDVAMLWQCNPAVIVGKHQNTYAEVNLPLADQMNIPVIRRISGGGTVFHDPGNINYSVITTVNKKDRMIDFRKFTLPIIEFLAQLGIKASFEGKNNLIISGRKFSGNSAHVYKSRVLHHGTILFDSDLNVLERIIQPTNPPVEDKAVKSIRATVTNIREHISHKIDLPEFKVSLQKFLINYHNISEINHISDSEKKAIKKLAKEKYQSWQWNHGYSPEFTLSNKLEDCAVELVVKNGFIKTINLIGKSPYCLELNQLKGSQFRRRNVAETLMANGIYGEDMQHCLKLLGLH